ncbi:MAG: TIM barrel protein [Opitutales bacterium]|nr:TIM barrel protein [Opitutales bacterium]
MKKISIIAFTFFVFTFSCFAVGKSSEADYPLGAFNFDFARLGSDEASQVEELKSIGYGGMTLRVNSKKQLQELERYAEAIGDAPFKIYAGFITVFFDQDLAVQNAHLDKVIRSLKKVDAKLWVILRVKGGQKVEQEQIVNFLGSLAERTKAEGVELVIYPHWSGGNPRNVCIIETAEDALPFVKAVGSDNLFISLHLCHEIMGGNGHRLNEVAANIKPWLRLPSINGADIDAVNEVEGWDRGIQPLTKGDYDSSELLEALKSVDYEGPVILHTWGLQKAAADHHHTSYKRYQDMVDDL